MIDIPEIFTDITISNDFELFIDMMKKCKWYDYSEKFLSYSISYASDDIYATTRYGKANNGLVSKSFVDSLKNVYSDIGNGMLQKHEFIFNNIKFKTFLPVKEPFCILYYQDPYMTENNFLNCNFFERCRIIGNKKNVFQTLWGIFMRGKNVYKK